MNRSEANPFVGPRPFEARDADRFFGRTAEVGELLSLVTAYPVVLLYSQSGAGKTSLLNAGVIPSLVGESFELLPMARVQGFEPEDVDLREISNIYVFNTLVRWAGERAQPRSLMSMSIAAFLQERERPTDEQGLVLPRVVIFDQFEELLTTYPDRWKEREDFIHQVAEALEADSLLRVLFVLREDYLAGLDSYIDFLPEQSCTRYRLERLSEEAACQAVEGPLGDTECSFAPGVASGLVQQLLKIRVESASREIIEVLGEYVEPVQLQIVCQSLWMNLPPHVTTITSGHLQAFGDVEEALKVFYERAVEIAAKESGVKKGELRKWFHVKLVTPAGTRGTVFSGEHSTGGIPNSAVGVLERQHIIRAERRAGARWYELTHDRLIEPVLKANEAWFRHRRSAVMISLAAMAAVLLVVLVPLLFRSPGSISFKEIIESMGGAYAEVYDPNYRQLNLANLPLRDGDIAQLKRTKEFQELASLRLTFSIHLTDAGLEHLRDIPLKRLDLSYSSGITDAGLEQLRYMPLQQLYLNYCTRITDAGLEHLKALSLVQLDLSRCPRITDAGLEHLRDIPLKRLDLSYCSGITDAGLEHLKDMPLELLGLHGLSQLTQEEVLRLEARRPGVEVLGQNKRMQEEP